MNIRILKATMAGGQYVKPGEIVETSEAIALTLLAMGKAEKVEAAPAEVVQLNTETAAALIAEKPKRGRKPKGI